MSEEHANPEDRQAHMLDPRIAFLHDLGFPDPQARAYLALAALGKATAREVSERARVPRTQVYALLDALAGAGLVERDGDAFVARTLRAFLETRLSAMEARRDGLVEEREDLVRAFPPPPASIAGDEVRLLRGTTRPAEVLTQWLDESGSSLEAAFTTATLTDALKDRDVGPALTDALTRLPRARIVVHAEDTGARLGLLPPHVIAVTRVARPEHWHCDRIVLDDARLVQRLSLGHSMEDRRAPYLALATAHADLVTDARAVMAWEWARALPALDVLNGDAARQRARAAGGSS